MLLPGVRRWTRDVLSGTPYADDAALIVSELGSNALLHSADGSPNGSFHVSLRRSSDALVLAVTDTGGGETKPRVETPDEDDTNGRGLGLVIALPSRVEVSGDDYGRTVTVEMAAEADEGGLYYCECYVNEHRLGTYDAHSPREALRWARISLMMIAITVDEEPYRQARTWLNDGKPTATRDLEEGKPHTLTLKQRTTAATWTISPIT